MNNSINISLRAAVTLGFGATCGVALFLLAAQIFQVVFTYALSW